MTLEGQKSCVEYGFRCYSLNVVNSGVQSAVLVPQLKMWSKVVHRVRFRCLN